MIASTFMDPVLGVDIHFEMVPTPAPVPTPLPNPFVGMVFDPLGLLVGQAVGHAVAMATGTAPLGPVFINGLPATNVGTEATNKLGVPHILIPPGTAWAPMPKLPRPSFKGPPDPPGPPVMPEGDAICVFGSQTVNVMGTSAVRLGDLAMSCGEPVRLPSSVVLAIPKGAPVLIGGPPAISIMDALGALVRSKWVAGYMHSLISRMPPGRLRNFLHRATCVFTGHPVDVATGRVMTDHVDWQLPGPLPLRFERVYSSAWANRSGPLGHGWSHSLDQAVWLERGKVVYLAEDGREIEFDTFDFPDHRLPVGAEVWEPTTRLTLRALAQGRYEVVTADGITHELGPVAGATGARQRWARLQRIRTRDGHAIELDYDARANLERARDSVGRTVHFEHDREGRLVAVELPHPEGGGWLPHTRYRYDPNGDLVEVVDPLGKSWRFRYKTHLLVQETDRNGLSFYFAYDGFGEDAFCVRTWGDGGIYDHVIDYDKKGRVTWVTNSLGHTTAYFMNPVGQVVKVVDPLGAATTSEYDERTLQKTKETDPLGHATTWVHDARGNLKKTTGPDGARVTVTYDDHHQPVASLDPVGGSWTWAYDPRGRLLGTRDSLGRTTQYEWRDGRLAGFHDPAGQYSGLEYDAHGNLVVLRAPDGKESRWRYDELGRCVASIDATGNEQRWEHDAGGRVVRVWEPDGNVRELEYDGEGKVVRARDRHQDVEMRYQGMGRLATRSQAGTTVRFEYDLEERLVAIHNEHGAVYRFELSARGQVEVERAFDGIRKRYFRDSAGRVVKVERPDQTVTTYVHDSAGRVVQVQYADGSLESFVYRSDGELVEATNGTGTVKLERDLIGRVVKEIQGEDWVESTYGARGLRVRVRSSKGLDQVIERNAVGDVLSVRASAAAVSSPFEARFTRDAVGLELERMLPGGVRARWERDELGRPVTHEVWTGDHLRSGRKYTWDPDDRLRMVVDAFRGPTRYTHDALGNLAAATHEDGRVDLRMPDAVGNLFRREDRSDRQYGPAGQLLEARGPAGVTRYQYDAEGNLARKIEPTGNEWTYHWDVTGMLKRVVRPDGEAVEFGYDPLGRRVWKKYRGRVTRWIWDGNVPLHEWVERGQGAPEATDKSAALRAQSLVADESARLQREAQLTARPAHGPPITVEATNEAPLTWLFEPESFSPLAKLVGQRRYAIVTDHLGTPTTMLDDEGREVWSAEIDVYGDLRNVVGERGACPFRWPGQYEDAETGLYYNRFRYYDPEAGEYASQDPIALDGGLRLHEYARDPLVWTDPFGLDRERMLQDALQVLRDHDAQIRQVFGENVDYGIRGSLSTNVRYGASREAGRPVPFNPNDFDVDAFVVDTRLRRRNAWPRPSRAVRQLSRSVEQALRALPGFENMRRGFGFRIWRSQPSGSTMAGCRR